MSSTKHPVAELVTASAGGKLGSVLEAHLDACGDCRELFDDLSGALKHRRGETALLPTDEDVSEAVRLITSWNEGTVGAGAWLDSHAPGSRPGGFDFLS